MATASTSRRLNLTRDQLAAFLTDQQQIRQFELLFSVVDEIQSIAGTDFEYQANTAAANANNALAQISVLAQDSAVDIAVLNAKVQQALDAIPRLTQALELLILSPRDELGTIASQNASNVKITGGTISGISYGGFLAGTVAAPSLYWTTGTATGFYQIAPNNIGYSYNGIKLLDLSSELLAITGGISVTKQITSTLATGTAPMVVASTTNVANLNASSLNGATFAAPGAIGGGTAGSGAFTTVTASTSIKPLAAAGYLSSDGSAGYTGTVTTASLVGKTITIKDGIITSFA
jgi:hypothetical protein